MHNYDKDTKTLINGAAWLGFSAIILKAIGLFYKIPMSYLLGDEGMGYFNSAYTVYTFFYIIGSAGIPKAVSILCAKSTSGEAKSIFLTVFKLYLLIGAILSSCLMIFSGPLAEIISSKNSALTILAISPSVFFVCASGVLRGYLTGKTRFIPIAISEMIGGLCKLILGLVFAMIAIKQNFPLSVICAFSILGVTVGAFLGFLYLLVYYKKESKNTKTEYKSKKKILSDVLKLGLPIAFAAALSNLVSLIDLGLMMNGLVSSGYSETVSAAIYGNYTTLCVPIFGLAVNLINTVTLASLPVITKAFTERKYTDLNLCIESSMKISLFIAIPAFIAFLLFPYEILSLLFELGSAKIAAAFLFCLAPGVIFYSMLAILNTILEGQGRIKAATLSLVFGAIIKCIFSFAMIKNDFFGALGAPISTSISYMFSFLVSLYVINNDRNAEIKIHRYFIKPLIIATVASIPAFVLKILLSTNQKTRINSLIILSLFGALYLSFTFFSTIKHKNTRELIAKCTKKKLFDY